MRKCKHCWCAETSVFKTSSVLLLSEPASTMQSLFTCIAYASRVRSLTAPVSLLGGVPQSRFRKYGSDKIRDVRQTDSVSQQHAGVTRYSVADSRSDLHVSRDRDVKTPRAGAWPVSANLLMRLQSSPACGADGGTLPDGTQRPAICFQLSCYLHHIYTVRTVLIPYNSRRRVTSSPPTDHGSCIFAGSTRGRRFCRIQARMSDISPPDRSPPDKSPRPLDISPYQPNLPW